jgi:metallophosphoesterase superfamily enzyme
MLRRDDAEGAAFRIFSENFERSFRRVFLYVSRRVNDREILERIVNDVLEENLDILVVQGDVPREVERLRASADRLIAQLCNCNRPRSTVA